MIYDKYEASSIRCFRSPPVAAAKAAWRSGKGRVANPWPWIGTRSKSGDFSLDL